MRRTARLERGFTIVEILVVIATIALLAIIVILSISPLEQIRKSRDARRYGDASQLYGAYQNYYSTYFEYPWDDVDVLSFDTSLPSSTDTINPEFVTNTDSYLLIDRNELRSSFISRKSIIDKEIFVSLPDGARVAVCIEPESDRGRTGGMGEIKDKFGIVSSSPDCALDYGTSSECFVCIP